MKKILIIFILATILITACTNDTQNNKLHIKEENNLTTDWKEIPLRDVRTSNSFKISDFKGKPILLESFAVWCPTCTRQQQEIKKLHEQVGDSIISISLDTDPSEDESRVRNHINSNDFTWYYAISPIPLTRSLINQFGNEIVNAPSAPVLLICGDQSKIKQLNKGVKSVSQLRSEVSNFCGNG